MKSFLVKASRISFFVLCVAGVLTLGAAPVANAEEIEGIELGDAMEITATVVALDPQNRVVSLRGPEGNVVDIEVSEEAQNFEQVSIGDEVTLAYYESVALYLGDASEAPEAGAGLVATRAAKGEKPAGIVVGVIDASVKILAIDLQNRAVTLELPDGEVVTTMVAENVRPLDSFTVGDTVHVRLTKAVAVSVE